MVDKLYPINSVLCVPQSPWKGGVFGSVFVGAGASFLVEEIRVGDVAM